MAKKLVVYSRTRYCPDVERARTRLAELGITYEEINIEEDPEAAQRVEAWTGFHSVPTIVVANEGDTVPLEDPTPLPSGSSPRGIDRGHIISEPSTDQLDAFLRKHDFLSQVGAR